MLYIQKNKGFSLAEMMVVMLMLSIIFAAAAPILTKRATQVSSDKCLWEKVAKATNNIFYKTGSVLVGTNVANREYANKSTSAQKHALSITSPDTNGGMINFWNDTTYTGHLSMPNNYNISIGNNTSTAGVAIGYKAITLHNHATAVGIGNTADKNCSTALGAYNTVPGIGSVAIGGSNTASQNDSIAIGYGNTASNYGSIAVGYDNNSSGDSSIAIGYRCSAPYNHSIAIGFGAKTTENSQIMLRGKLYVETDITYGGTLSKSSDKRLKNIGEEFNLGLDKIREIHSYNFTYKKDKEKTKQVGVIAQDLQKVFPNSVKKEGDGYLSICKDEMFYAIINAIKELDKSIQKLVIQVNELTLKIDKLIEINNVIMNDNKEIKERLNKLENKRKFFN